MIFGFSNSHVAETSARNAFQTDFWLFEFGTKSPHKMWYQHDNDDSLKMVRSLDRERDRERLQLNNIVCYRCAGIKVLVYVSHHWFNGKLAGTMRSFFNGNGSNRLWATSVTNVADCDRARFISFKWKSTMGIMIAAEESEFQS